MQAQEFAPHPLENPAQAVADGFNQRLGLSEKDVTMIVASSMRGSAAKRK